MKKSRKVVSLVMSLTILASVSLTGCGSQTASNNTTIAETTATAGTAGTAKSTDNSAKPVELKVWWADGDQFKSILLDAINNYRNDYPNVKITPEWQPNFDQYDKLKVAIAGSTAPDLTKMDSVNVPAMGFKNQLIDFNQFGANDIKDKFLASCWALNLYKDKVYGIPFDANTIAFYYNKDILDKAGVQPPKTYDDIIAAGKAINAKKMPGITAYTVPLASNQSGWLAFQYTFWLWREGGDLLNADWTKATFNGPEGLAALQKILDLQAQGIIPKNQYIEGDFYQGKVGMLDMGCWNVPQITGKDKKANFGITTMPVLKNGVPGYSGIGLYSLVVLSGSENQTEAADFSKYLATSKQYQVDYAKKTNLMPSLTEAYDDEFFKIPEWQAFLEQLKIAKGRPGTPAWPEINDALTAGIQEALAGKKAPQQALDDAAAKADAALAKVQ